jgi:hypothetical protein
MREFHGEWNMGPFHCFPFRLAKRGDSTILHAHEHDHLSRSNKRTALYAILPNGVEKVDVVGAFGWRLVKAGVQHIVLALEDNCECECLFSRYDENGHLLDDPKHTIRHEAYREVLKIRLPALLEEVLRREGVERETPAKELAYDRPRY